MKSTFNGKQNCLIVAGEKSGEEHFLSFFSKLQSAFPDMSWWGVGGELMRSQGIENIYNLKDFSTWGFSEALRKIPFYFLSLRNILQQVSLRKTQFAILVDFQSFNLILAKRLSQRGVTIFYYVAPQAWAWHSKRTNVLRQSIHTLFTLIPFEKKWFENRGVPRVVGVPHPLWVQYKNQLPANKEKNSRPICLLLPGSRNSEVELNLPEFIHSIESLKEIYPMKVTLVASSNVNEHLYSPYRKKIDVIYGSEQTTKALREADYALAASGTVTLATALFLIPTIVTYKGNLFNEFIFYNLIKYDKLICLPNIICQEEIFPELLQNRATSFNIKRTLLNWMNNGNEYLKTQSKLLKLREILKRESADCGSYIEKHMREICDKATF